MSKRSGSPSAQPLKLIKVDDEWTIAPSQTDVDLRSSETSRRPAFKPAPPGPKARILQNYLLSYKPKVEVSISLRGNQPEVRFADPDSSMCITGDELLQLANCRDAWPTKSIFLLDTRVEPLGEGACRFARYDSAKSEAQEMDMFATSSFTLSKYSVVRLKTKLDMMSEHIFKILESESTINEMFNCVVKAYLLEHQRLRLSRPIINHFDELRQLVESYVQQSHLVKDFCMNTSGSCWNHYALLTAVLAQKRQILFLLQINDI